VLQDFALAIHPPMLYTGYVGFSVAFAFAIAANARGTGWTRHGPSGERAQWTIFAWLFQTIGIALGSWWEPTTNSARGRVVVIWDPVEKCVVHRSLGWSAPDS